MNYFIEGIQGSGKSTLVEKISQRNAGYCVFKEGYYSPVELAWCAYVDEETYQKLLVRYPNLDIRGNTYPENDRRIICYTKIMTDDRCFYQDLEQYEIYNDRRSFEEFGSIILDRYSRWNGEDSIFECSLLQNITEELILYKQLNDEQILSFYRKIKDALAGKEYTIIYLKSDDIRNTLDQVRRERTDENGKPVWFEMLKDYFNSSPYAIRNSLKDEEGIITHLIHRQKLELKICKEIFNGHYLILDSKNYSDKQLDLLDRS